MALAAMPLDMDSAGKLLIVEDDLDLREAVEDTLMLSGYEVVTADSGEVALQRLAAHSDIQCVISDVNMGGMDGHELLRQIKKHYPHIPVVLNTAYGSIDRSVEAMRDGAVDYLVKPFEPKLLLETVGRYVGNRGGNNDGEPIASDPASQQLLQLARRVAETDATALIIGESGTGKEVLARYIHNHSPRAKQPFVAVNCAAIPENMLEAMLFGHEKGAFTGAYTSAPGKFEQADGGTLLLDEISEMDLGLQAKLLRVLQEREVERLGGRKTIPLNVRVIATSNRNMREYVAEGKFREDLYFRLSVLPLQWAPLRDRKADILPLAEQLLAKHSEKQHRPGMQISPAAADALVAHSWPGNVRELDNVIQRALILQTGETIEPHDLGLEADVCFSDKPSLMSVAVTPDVTDTSSSHQVQEASALVVSSVNKSAEVESEEDMAPDLGGDLKQREFEIIANTLKQERGSKKNTAARLGISPRTLRYKIARLKEMGMDINQLAY
ncbi:MAG: sigma-54-dependent response regulator transcription factor FleR [Candidatus Pelagadaptatus aseana]|uniref:sigma-54-dependent transcriptional regulator n=1 Tax=Candidatus Pelagadaptatus aseana TaxID=3120508 RepID=UPI0039B22028